MSKEFHKNHFRSSGVPTDRFLSLWVKSGLGLEPYEIGIATEEPIWPVMLKAFDGFADAHADEGHGATPAARREVYRSSRGGGPKALRARVPGALREELDLISDSMGETRYSALLRALEEYADAHREESNEGMRRLVLGLERGQQPDGLLQVVRNRRVRHR